MTTLTVIRQARVMDPAVDAGVLVDIAIRGGHIEGITALNEIGHADAHNLDATGHLVMPGLVNGHTHAHGALGRGAVPDRVTLETFLAMSAAINGERSLADIQLSAQLTAVELLRKGCTACFDMALELPAPSVQGLLAVGEAYQAVGLRAVVAPMLADRTLYQAYPDMAMALPPKTIHRVEQLRMPDAAGLLAVWREAHQAWPFDRQQVQLGIAPTIPLHCSDELLEGCGRLSAEFNIPLQTHLSESKLQAMLGRQMQGESPVQSLARLGCLSPRTSVAHAVWLDDNDMALLAQHGVTAVHNPLSNLRLGSGLAAVRQMLDARVDVAVGTDGSNTSDGQNLFEAMRMAAYLSRLTTADTSQWVDADTALRMTSVTGPQVIGLGGHMGQIAAGQLADLLFIDLNQPHYVPLRHLLRQMVFAESGHGLRRVMVHGRIVLDEGQVLGIDEAKLQREADLAARRLDAACTAARGFAENMLPTLAAYCCQANALPFSVQRRLPA
jgi:5-methylthioadenosine/S-adenosylhomocysteine deaminase